MLTAHEDEEETPLGMIDQTIAQALARRLLESAIEIGREFGLRVTTRGCRWEDASCSIRIEYYNALSPHAPPRERVAHQLWLKECKTYELSRHQLGRTFRVDGESHEVLGLEIVHDARFVLARRTGAEPNDNAAMRLFPLRVAAHALSAVNIDQRIAKEKRNGDR